MPHCASLCACVSGAEIGGPQEAAAVPTSAAQYCLCTSRYCWYGASPIVTGGSSMESLTSRKPCTRVRAQARGQVRVALSVRHSGGRRESAQADDKELD